MVDLDGTIDDKVQEIKLMKERGENPFPYRYEVASSSDKIKSQGKLLCPGENLEGDVSTAGRIIAVRSMGKISFYDLQDERGKIQLCARKNKVGSGMYNQLRRVSVGDIIGIKGKVFRTRRGELSIDVSEYTLLSKSLRNFPEKFHGLKNQETRYRQRELDLIMNPEVKEIFRKRSQAITLMRDFLDGLSFMEVEIPTLQTVYGGASARPFTTHLNALNIDLYLSISPELYLKRLVVGGLEKVYSICKNFRNEGIDKTHNPEFTMMECYWAYADYNDMMCLTEEMYESIFQEVNGKTTITYLGNEIDFKSPWKRISMYDAIKSSIGINVAEMSREEIVKVISDNNLDKIPYVEEDETRGELVQQLFEQYVEKKLIGPTFITDHPKESTPLCKQHRNDPELIERFEPFVMGMEIGNAYSELNDPILQRRLFEEQAERLRMGDLEAHPFDKDFLRALEYGLPPTGGLGLGIDRMVMLLTEQYSIKDVILFPFMRPEE